MKNVTFLLLLSILPLSVCSQISEKNTLWMEYLDQLADSETMEAASIEQLFDELSYLSEHPYNLNVVSKKELETLPFLSDIQIENLLYYTYRNAPLTTIYELKNVEDLDHQTIAYLLPFVYIEDVIPRENIKPKEIIQYGRHELILRSDYCLQKKAGYEQPSEEALLNHSSNFYLGENYYASLKYGFQYKDKIQLGFVGEKDPGEAFWNQYHHGFDYYSGSLIIKDIGIIQSIHLGDYRVSYGQGLVVNTDFSMGKTSFISAINKKTTGVKKHFSTNENNYFRGSAITLGLGNLVTSLFYSHNSLDANADSSSIYTFKTDGYNRTFNDLKKHGQASSSVLGGNVQWKNAFFDLGLTGIYYAFGGKALDPEQKDYTHYYLRGEDNYNLGIHYGFRRKKYSLSGETAIGKNGAIATLNTLLVNPASFIDFIFSYRNYALDYQSHYGKALSESSQVQNESGFYSGIKFRLFKYCEISAYLDQFQFPWLKHGVDSPSSGTDALMQLSYIPNRSTAFNIRYKYKKKYKNSSHETALVSISPYTQQRWRGQANFELGEQIHCKSQIEYNYYSSTQLKSKGLSISQLTGYAPKGRSFQLDFGLAYFHTDDWNNRITAYEKNILYAFSFPSYYGEGLRYYSVFKWKLSKQLTFHFKIASTHYFDRNTISSGLDEISGKEKTDIYCLLRVKL